MRNNYLLDADETILDFLRSSRESFAQAMAWAGMARFASDYEKFRAVNDALWKAYERGEVTKSRLVVERFARFFAAEGVEADAAAVNGRYFGTLCATGYLLPGAAEFLRALRARGKVYLITNGTPAAQYGRLASLGLENFFDGIYISDEIGYKKPDVRFFAYLLEREKIGRENCLVIGDSLSSDIAGANNAGIRCIWYNPSGRAAEGAAPDYTAKSYREILRLADEWSARG